MPLPIKISASKTQPKKTRKALSKTPTKRKSRAVSAQPSSKTKKTAGSPSKQSDEITFPRIPDDILSFVSRTLTLTDIVKINSLNKSFRSKKIIYNLEKVDLRHVTINNIIIDALSHLNKEKVKKLILQNIKFKDQDSFDKFIEIFKSFINIEELKIDGFWSDQYLYKKANGEYNKFFITIIMSIEFLKKLKKLTIKKIDIEEETVQDRNTDTEEEKKIYLKHLFTNALKNTLNNLPNLKYFKYKYNRNNIDTCDKIRRMLYWIENIDKNGRKIDINKDFRKIDLEMSDNITLMERRF